MSQKDSEEVYECAKCKKRMNVGTLLQHFQACRNCTRGVRVVSYKFVLCWRCQAKKICPCCNAYNLCMSCLDDVRSSGEEPWGF